MTLEMAWSIASQREILGGKTLVLWKGHAMLDAEGFNAVELTHNSFDRIYYPRRLQRMSWNKLVEQESFSRPMVTCCG